MDLINDYYTIITECVRSFSPLLRIMFSGALSGVRSRPFRFAVFARFSQKE